MAPPERVNQVVDIFPDACRHCHHALPARRRAVTGEPRRHQITDLPPIAAYITEYQCPHVVCPACGKTTQAPDAPCQELEQALKRQPVLNGDETGHRTHGDKRWLWAIVAPAFVVYRIATTRVADVLVAPLGDVFAGILCSDRWRPYQTDHRGELQCCWAHFKRNMLGALDLANLTEAERFCRDALALQAQLFRLWYRFRGDPAAVRSPVSH